MQGDRQGVFDLYALTIESNRGWRLTSDEKILLRLLDFGKAVKGAVSMAKKLCSLGSETEQIEFMKSTGELKEAVISIVAILNKHNKGKLYF